MVKYITRFYQGNFYLHIDIVFGEIGYMISGLKKIKVLCPNYHTSTTTPFL